MSAFTLANWEPVKLSINTEAEIAKSQALDGARPDLVTLEPKTNAINSAIRQAGERNIPGLEIFEEIDTAVRS